jgi:thiamine phosphate synthase YjbQ (UPF0047 family)
MIQVFLSGASSILATAGQKEAPLNKEVHMTCERVSPQNDSTGKSTPDSNNVFRHVAAFIFAILSLWLTVPDVVSDAQV